jgi:hypothetical protein
MEKNPHQQIAEKIHRLETEINQALQEAQKLGLHVLCSEYRSLSCSGADKLPPLCRVGFSIERREKL